MYKNKYKKIMILCSAIIFAITSIAIGILAEDVLHTMYCDVPNCSLCNLIHFANKFMESMIVLALNVLILRLLISLVQYISRNCDTIGKQTLVKLKVIKNE